MSESAGDVQMLVEFSHMRRLMNKGADYDTCCTILAAVI